MCAWYRTKGILPGDFVLVHPLMDCMRRNLTAKNHIFGTHTARSMEMESGIVWVKIRRVQTIFDRIASIGGLGAAIARDACACVVYGTNRGIAKSHGCWNDRYREARVCSLQ